MPDQPKTLQKAKQRQVVNFCDVAREVIEIERTAVGQLLAQIDNNFAIACELILDCKGRVIVTGMGKSGHIAKKISATLASTGTPSFFIHPGEAIHGDLGMLTSKDILLAISNSGNTEEILKIIPTVKLLHIPLITFTGNRNSMLAQTADINIPVAVEKEACPLGLSPTSSSTAALVMGDALAVALLQAKGFTKSDYALSHPGGSLGKRLLLNVTDVMVTGKALPIVSPETLVKDALLVISEKGLGMTIVLDENQEVCGIFTDGDLRRTFNEGKDIHTTRIHEVMTKNAKRIPSNTLAAEALQIMETYKITSLLVIDDNKLQGIVHMHPLLQAGIK